MKRSKPRGPQSELERQVSDRYKMEGYEVSYGVDLNKLPIDLDGYIPDIIAIRGDEKLIIEVKGGGYFAESVDKYVELAKRVKNNPPWRFVLVTAKDIWNDTAVEPDHWSAISLQYKDAKVVDNGIAKTLLLWSILEAILRRRSNDSGLPLERSAPRQLIDNMYSLGELSQEDFAQILSINNVRNRLAHGFWSDDAEAVSRVLVSLVDKFLMEWKPSTNN